MRPLLLDLENIGPFVGRTTVDFSLFDDSSLFLITGKTGSGKSFLFDSICYALYGQTPSGREDNLSSDFSKTGERPRILFRFSIGKDLYEVERNLPYEDAKQRGSGTKVRPESQTLRRMTPVTEVLATKKTEVTRRCEELLQLKMDQFSRVIMIPQGEFRELLRSDTEERERLLRQLFRSFTYLDLARALEEEYKAQNGKYLDMKKETGVVLDQLLKRLPQEEIPQEDSLGVEAILEHRKRIEGSIPSLRESIDMLFRQYEGSREISRWMDDVLRLHRTKGELSSEFERSVRTGVSDIDPLRESVRRHDLASDFVPLLNVISERTSRMAKLDVSLSQMVADLEIRDNALSTIKKEKDKVPLLKARYELILSNQGRLSTLQADIDRSKELNRTLLKRSREEKRLNDILSGIASRSQKLVSDFERINKDIAVRREPITDIETAKSKQVVVLDLIEVMKERSLLVPGLERNGQLISAMAERSDQLQKELNELRRYREGSLSYELASALADGNPCSVCGSLDHPSPAAPPARIVKKEEVDTAEEAYRGSLSELEALRSNGLKVLTSIEGYDRRVGQMVQTYPELKGLAITTLTIEQNMLKETIRNEKKRTSELEGLQRELIENNTKQSTISEERSSPARNRWRERRPGSRAKGQSFRRLFPGSQTLRRSSRG
ncbi:MAG: SMC family ATPase [Candidatus Thermoplasmatota archaeon]|nr:SMC family ATPase [Candidatus Thermoplasmatota archaeon]